MANLLEFEFGFLPDPDLGQGASTEETASWGWFILRVNGINLCEHVVDSEVVDRVHWYLLPLFEWFTANWDGLLHESKMPPAFKEASCARQAFRSYVPSDREDEDDVIFDWWERHSVRSAAGGGIFPDVFIRRLRSKIEFSWGHARVAGAPEDLRFLATRESCLIEPESIIDGLYNPLKRAILELEATLPKNPRVTKLSRAFTKLRDARTLDRTAWMAGLGNTVSDSKIRVKNLIRQLGGKFRDLVLPSEEPFLITRPPSALLMFGAVSPTITDEDVRTMLNVLAEMSEPIVRKSSLPSIQKTSDSRRAWEQGYDWAERSRSTFNIGETPYKLSMENLLTRSGVIQRNIQLSDNKIRAIAVYDENDKALIAINSTSQYNENEQGLRFTLAHELCHLLFDCEHGVPLAVASGPWAPAEIEARANAFAAMFLMPRASCIKLIDETGQGKLTRANLVHVAGKFGTAKVATLKHLKNLRLIDEDDEFALLEDLSASVHHST